MARRDWVEWHRDYDDPGSLLSRRGECGQGPPRAEGDRAPAGDVRLISLCAGQGRDVIGVLTGHPRRDDVRARLVELDERNVAVARQAVRAAGLDGVEVLQADAGTTDACVGAVPAKNSAAIPGTQQEWNRCAIGVSDHGLPGAPGRRRCSASGSAFRGNTPTSRYRNWVHGRP